MMDVSAAKRTGESGTVTTGDHLAGAGSEMRSISWRRLSPLGSPSASVRRVEVPEHPASARDAARARPLSRDIMIRITAKAL